MTISIVTGADALECSAPLSDQMPRGRFPPNFFLIPSVAPEGIILPPVLTGEGRELQRGQRAFLAPRVSEVRAEAHCHLSASAAASGAPTVGTGDLGEMQMH